MRTWKRAELMVVCGRCVNFIQYGDPMLLIHIPGVKEAKRRCQDCAGEPVPEDLPAVREAVEPSGMTQVGKVRLPFDFKAAQVGNDE